MAGAVLITLSTLISDYYAPVVGHRLAVEHMWDHNTDCFLFRTECLDCGRVEVITLKGPLLSHSTSILETVKWALIEAWLGDRFELAIAGALERI